MELCVEGGRCLTCFMSVSRPTKPIVDPRTSRLRYLLYLSPSQARVQVTRLVTAFDDSGNILVRLAFSRCHVMLRQHSGYVVN